MRPITNATASSLPLLFLLGICWTCPDGGLYGHALKPLVSDVLCPQVGCGGPLNRVSVEEGRSEGDRAKVEAGRKVEDETRSRYFSRR